MWLLLSIAQAAPVALPHSPDLHDDTIVFAAGDALWTVPVSGGLATQLTELPGVEDDPHWAPDGRTVIFSAQHDGNTEVYALAPGSAPQRLSFHGGRDRPVAVDLEGTVWLRSARAEPSGLTELFRVPLAGGPVEAVPWGIASDVATAPDGTIAWVDRDWDWAPWDRQLGGQSPRLRITQDNLHQSVPIAGLRSPMWRAGRLWAVGEHETGLRLCSLAPDGSELRWEGEPTQEVQDASVAPDGRIVYVSRDELHVLDLAGRARRVRLRMPPAAPAPLQRGPEHAALVRGPGGALAALNAGHAWISEDGNWQPWHTDPQSSVTAAAWDGQGQLWTLVDDGVQQRVFAGRQALPLGEGWRALAPSPDARWLAGLTLDGKVLLVDLDSPRAPPRLLGQSAFDPPPGLHWSRSSTELVFALREASGRRRVWSTTISGSPEPRTPTDTDDHSPRWSADGQRLLFQRAHATGLAWDRQDPELVATGEGTAMWMPAEGGPSQRDTDPPQAATSVEGPAASRPFVPAAVQLVGQACRQAAALTARNSDALDCAAARERAALVRSPTDLKRVLDDMLADLQAPHVFAMPGTRSPRPRSPAAGRLGGQLSWTGAAWAIDRRWEADPRQPLPAPLVDAGIPEGACITALEGQRLDAASLSSRLPPAGGSPVQLSWWDCGRGAASSHTSAVTLLARDRELQWSDRSRRRSEALRAATARDDVGYLLLPDISDRGLQHFLALWPGVRSARWLVLDLRGNGGGWGAEAVLSRIERPPIAGFQWHTGAEQAWPLNASTVSVDHVLVLIDGNTMSEGEVLARALQLRGATLIGTPSWGGRSGTVAGPPLLDGTTVHVPGVVWKDPGGDSPGPNEGQGLSPDLPVVDARVPGTDPWLEAAARWIQEHDPP